MDLAPHPIEHLFVDGATGVVGFGATEVVGLAPQPAEHFLVVGATVGAGAEEVLDLSLQLLHSQSLPFACLHGVSAALCSH